MSRQDVMTTDLMFIGSARRIRGDFANATPGNRPLFQSSVANSNTAVGVATNGTGTISSFQLFGGSDPNNASILQLYNYASGSIIEATRLGSGVYTPIMFNTSNVQRMVIAVDGTVTIGGSLTVSTNLTVTGTLTIGGGTNLNSTINVNTTDAQAVAAGTGNFSLMIQTAGGGAARITFHRPGAFAAYFGLDTDNLWKVGGWSMGGVSYKVHHDGVASPLLIDPAWRGLTAFTIPTSNDLTNYMFYYGTGTATLPSPSGRAGQIRFIKAWGGPVTVNSAGTNLMAPGSQSSVVSSFVLAIGDSLTMITDGSYWWTV